MDKVDLLVCNYQTQPLLERLLNILHSDTESHWRPWNLYVADNGSTDGSYDWLTQNKDKYYIEHVDKNENVGYARAINKMATYGSAEIIGILNADVWLRTADVEKVIRAFNDQEVSVLGVKQRNEEGLITGCPIVWDGDRLRHDGWRALDPADKHYRYRVEVPTVSGSVFFVRRQVWDTLTQCSIYRNEEVVKQDNSEYLGALLPTAHYFEETYLNFHARFHGFKVFFDGTVSCGHSWAASTGGSSPILNKFFLESKEIYRRACINHGIKHEVLD